MLPVPPNAACALYGHGACSSKISSEHYIPLSILNCISSDRSITISGTFWTGQESKKIGKSSLVANIICERHNADLGVLDSAASRFMRSIQSAQIALQARSLRSKTHTFFGVKIERWFLKVAFMMWYSGNFAFNGSALPGKPPDRWAAILMEEEPFPAAWGLYVPTSHERFMAFEREFAVSPFVGIDGSGIKAVHFEIARFPFLLMMGTWDDPNKGHRRPSKIDVTDNVTCHSLRLNWPAGEAGKPITFRRFGDAPTNPGE